MSDNQQVNKRIAKNSVFLYVRMLVIVAIGLYASRVVLHVLGASDFGLYNVVGGIITLFTVFSAALNDSTQRFLSYAIGDNDADKLKRSFSIAFGIHVALAVIILVLAETLGLWFLYNHLNIPDGRQTAAVWVYQFSVITFLVGLIKQPFHSCLIAHERMHLYAYVSIYDAIMKLLIVFLLQWVSFDKLIVYGFLMFLLSISSALIYYFYCRRAFEECTLRIVRDKGLTKEIVVYCGWSLFGGGLDVFNSQSINILLNVFCGTIVNAARGLSMSIYSNVSMFVNSFLIAVNPQIIKQYAAKEWESLHKLVMADARIAEYLFLLVAIPVFIETDFLLKLWLGEYPEYTVIFIQLFLIQQSEYPLDYPLGMLIQASGKLKWPSIIANLPLVSVTVISYVLLKSGYSPVSVYVACAVVYFWKNIANLYFANKYTGISVSKVIKKVYLNVITGGSVMFLVPLFVSFHMEEGLVRFLVVGTVSVITSIIVIYYWGLTPELRVMVKNRIQFSLNKEGHRSNGNC